MVKAMIDISERTNRVLNVIKAKHGLKDKSEAINKVVSEYEQHFLDIRLHPEYQKKQARKQKGLHFKNLDELRKYIERM
ncbi:MAG TPA: antitoxin [Candidatus Nanoarchaeia archaeon]|nr:antitoxin [Candidatus Nanoarchaeia archaeon]